MKHNALLSAGTPLLVAAAAVLAVGDLNPPAGSVTATGKTLLEVEPRIAINATNTPGDADSVFKITQPGSFYITGNVSGAVGKHGIEIAASNVTIDLAGFVVDGGGISGALDGIRTSSSGLVSLAISNGKVSNWSGDGIDLVSLLSENSLVERIEATGNSATGIRIGSSSVADRCTAKSNGVNGFFSTEGCSVLNCTARSNGSTGFALSSSNFVSGCVAVRNLGNGLTVSFDSTIRDCVATSNTQNGISGTYSSILDCTANLNGSSGIALSSACIVRGNTCSSNGTLLAAAGIFVLGSDNRIEDNNCTQNSNFSSIGIDVNGVGNVILRNSCSGNSTNWDVVAGNALAPIVNATTNATAVLGSTYAGSLGSTDPNANFSY